MRRIGFFGIAPAARTGLLTLTLMAGGCSTSSLNLFGSSSTEKVVATNASPNASIGDDDVECPGVTVRSGASTLSLAAKSTAASDPSALELRYQGTIVRTARECHVAAGTMTMKVGIEGRVIVGPAGGPGQLDVPLRLAVVQEGPQAKTVLSKLVRIPVTVGDGAPFVNFTHIDSEIAFPLPQPLGNIDSYIVYVGFDPNALNERPKAAAKPRRRR
ncbi:MAG: hypothetical protein ACR2K5_01605 [Pseudolabrys sp.]